MYLGQNYCKMFRAVYSIYFRVHTQIEPRIGCDVLFMFCPCLLCLVSNLKCLTYCVLVTEKKVWKFIWNYFLFTTWMINKLDHLEISIVKSNQNFGWSKRGFLPQIFVSWWKLKWQITLCSNKMLLKRPQTSNQIFSRTLDERLLEQKQKFAVFSLHYFCTMLLLAVLLALRAE